VFHILYFAIAIDKYFSFANIPKTDLILSFFVIHKVLISSRMSLKTVYIMLNLASVQYFQASKVYTVLFLLNYHSSFGRWILQVMKKG